MIEEKKIQENVSLKPYNTFGVDAKARYFFDAQTVDDLLWIVHNDIFDQPKLIIGGGSNMLLTDDFDGLVLKISLIVKWVEKSDGNKTLVSVMAGENWHEFVLWSLEQGLGGLENLSLIPGNVGSAPIQNIGAYGVEMKDTFHHLEALNTRSGEFEIFTKKECNFGYRDSYFKRKGKGSYIITRVFFELTNADHKLDTRYGAIEQEINRLGLTKSIYSISEAVCNIRNTKLPDPSKLGNSGSFFKNPVVPELHYEKLKTKFPNIVAYPSAAGVKLAAGWMIDQAGWKGHRKGDAAVHDKQALVLVNHGNATGKEIETLALNIKKSVKEKFGVDLRPEVNIIGSSLLTQ